MKELRHEDSHQYYETHKALYEERHGPLTVAADGVLRKAAEMEHIANLAQESIERKGIHETRYISSTKHNEAENRDVAQYLKICVQQTRLLASLKLLPGNRATIGRDGDEGDEPDDLQDC